MIPRKRCEFILGTSLMCKKEGEMFLFRLKMIHLDFEGDIQISASQVNIIK